MPVLEDVFVPRSPLTPAEDGVRWKRVNRHILEQRASLEAQLQPLAKRIGYMIGEGIPHEALSVELTDLMARLLEDTYAFGITEAQREIALLRSGQGVQAIDLHAGDEAPLRARRRFEQLAEESVESVVTRASGAEGAVAAASEASKAMHNAVLNTVGMSLNLGRTQGAMTAPGGPPTYALRSEQLDKATCDACSRLHGEIAQVNSDAYYALLPPTACYGGGRCRGVMVFGDGPRDIRAPEPPTGYPMGPPGYVPKSLPDQALQVTGGWGVRVVDPVPGPNVGIHARAQSGFGNSETLTHFRTATRDTGHFGTGTYFVSDASKLRAGSYAQRDLVGIDLTGKNLYRPVDERFAVKTHDALREVNDLAASKVALRTDTIGDLQLQALLTDLPPGITPAELRAIIMETRRDLAAGNFAAETASTRVMRKLGYDGIDVRHIDALDNTRYGSVLYRDLRAPQLPPALVEQAIDTADATANAARDLRIYQLRKRGMTTTQIARETGLSTTRVGRILKEQSTSLKARDALIREMRRQGHSLKEIGETFGLSGTRIGRILNAPPTAGPPRPLAPRAPRAPRETPKAAPIEGPYAAQKLGHRYADWRTQLTQDERDALESYLRGGSVDPNRRLRGKLLTPQADPTEVQWVINNIDSAISKSPGVGDDMYVYRGLGANWRDEITGLGDGAVMTEHAYLSTTLDRAVAESFSEGGVLMRIRVPKGTQAAWAPDLSDMRGELLIARGMQIRITKLDRIGDRWVAEAELIPKRIPKAAPAPTGMKSRDVFTRVPAASRPQWQAADEGFKAIDKVIKVPERLRGRVQAGGQTSSLGHFNRARRRDGKPEIMLSRDLRPGGHYASYANEVAVHEYGHLVDRLVAQVTVGTTDIDRSSRLVVAWWDAVMASPTFQRVRATNNSYLKAPSEVFARSFLQWIALRSGNETLLKEIRLMRDGWMFKDWQWDDDEFLPIARALDDLLRQFMR